MFRRVPKLLATMGLALTLSASFGLASVSAANPPSGESKLGQTVIEPAYDAANGTLVYLSTPGKAVTAPGAPVVIHPNFTHNVAPIYLPVYPAGSTVVNSNTLNCQDVPVEDCPDHGPQIAGLAQFVVNPNGVYTGGVLGHDHVLGIASTWGDFNILWEPVVLLFTNATAANEHLTTLTQINAELADGDVIPITLSGATFHCSVVSAAVFAHATPWTTP